MQMDKEMKELKQQRNLAQSRLEDLLRAIGEERSSKQLVREYIYIYMFTKLLLLLYMSVNPVNYLCTVLF